MNNDNGFDTFSRWSPSTAFQSTTLVHSFLRLLQAACSSFRVRLIFFVEMKVHKKMIQNVFWEPVRTCETQPFRGRRTLLGPNWSTKTFWKKSIREEKIRNFDPRKHEIINKTTHKWNENFEFGDFFTRFELYETGNESLFRATGFSKKRILLISTTYVGSV